MFQRLIKFNFAVGRIDFGLLVFRIGMFGNLFIRQGIEKFTGFSRFAKIMPDPFHIGHPASFAIAMISDDICSILLILGLATRWVGLFTLSTLFVAFAFVNDFQFLNGGPTSWAGHGEGIVSYMVSLVVIIITGPGRFSIDELLRKSFAPASAGTAENRAPRSVQIPTVT